MLLKKKVLLTGASRGIGKSIANILLSDRQFEVIGTSRHAHSPSGDLSWIPLDLQDPASVGSCFERTGPVDVLICNAGQSQFGPAEELPTDKVRSLFEVNLFSTMELVRQYLPSMRERGSGLIILVGSLTGEFSLPYFSSYSASKFALRGFARSLRLEMRPFGVWVSLVEPNDIKTTIEPEMFLGEESAYAPSALRVRAIVRRNMENANPPEAVARVVWHICQVRNPGPVYPIGGLAPQLVFLKRLLPNRFVDFLLRKMYGIR